VIRRSVVLIGLAALMFFAYLTGNRTAFAMLYATLGLAAVAWTWTYLGWRGLKVHRSGLGGAYEVGEEYQEHIEASNGSRVSLPWMEFIDYSVIPGYNAGRLLSLRPRGRRRWRTEGRFELRGRYRLGPAELIAGDPFGFFRRSKQLPAGETVTVYPRLVDVSRMLPGSAHALGDTIASGRHADAPPDASGIREHVPEDGFSRIHWPSTARLGQPMSRVFERFEGSNLVVLLDLQERVHRGSGALSTLEYGVSLAASVAVEMINRGQPVGLACNDRRQTRIEVASGLEHLGRILDFLAEAQADRSAPLDSLLAGGATGPARHHALVVTPNADRGWVDVLVRSDQRSGRRTTVFSLDASTFDPRQAGARGARPPRPISYADDRLVWWRIEAGHDMFQPVAPGSATTRHLERAL
jgi:uncharacterized protein (DUF58 family)